MVEFNRQKRIL